MYICMYSCNMHNHFMQTVQLKCLKFYDIYFLQEMDLLVLDPTVLTMVVDVIELTCLVCQHEGTMMPCGIMHTTSLFCGDMASWEQVTAVLYQAVVCGKLDRHFQMKMDNTLGSKFID